MGFSKRSYDSEGDIFNDPTVQEIGFLGQNQTILTFFLIAQSVSICWEILLS
jgi:hypothetical protein